MLKLIVTRHAKSSWDYPNLTDHDRPLSGRGKRSSDAIGKWLAEKDHVPETVLSSTSTRTRETWARMSKNFPDAVNVRFEPDLYHAGSSSMFNLLTTASGDSVLILGHNPGIAHFAAVILNSMPTHADFYRYPTAATLVCEFPIDDWAHVEIGTAKPIDFVIPRELE